MRKGKRERGKGKEEQGKGKGIEKRKKEEVEEKMVYQIYDTPFLRITYY
jgi:hypothetical protein